MAKQENNIAQKVESLVRPVVEGHGLRLWDLRFEKEGTDWFLKVLIERDELMDTDTCEVISRAIDPLLDNADYIDQSYYLEVGSPGLGRRLQRPEHFEQVKGQKIMAVLFRPDDDGEREVSGLLLEKTADILRLQQENGTETEIPTKNISYCKLCDDENLFAKK